MKQNKILKSTLLLLVFSVLVMASSCGKKDVYEAISSSNAELPISKDNFIELVKKRDFLNKCNLKINNLQEFNITSVIEIKNNSYQNVYFVSFIVTCDRILHAIGGPSDMTSAYYGIEKRNSVIYKKNNEWIFEPKGAEISESVIIP